MSDSRLNIAVFCGSRPGNDSRYAMAAKALGFAIAKRNIGLVYGGGDLGLMGHVANSVTEGGGQVVGVIPEFLNRVRDRCTKGENIIVADFLERKRIILEKSDACIALPGGIGTLDEITDVLTAYSLDLHAKPVGLLNVENYYNRLVQWFDYAIESGFMTEKARHGLIVSQDVEELLDEICNRINTKSLK